MQTYWGIDLGGTKTEGVVLSAKPGTVPTTDAVLIRKRIDTEAHRGYDHILSQMVRLIDQLKAETGLTPDRIGFGTPGTFDPARQTMKNCNTTVLNGKPMKQDLERLLGLPVEVANDANCFALAEATLGIVPDRVPNYQTIFGVIMGTGVGGGVVVRGRDGLSRPGVPFVLNGLQGIGGEGLAWAGLGVLALPVVDGLAHPFRLGGELGQLAQVALAAAFQAPQGLNQQGGGDKGGEQLECAAFAGIAGLPEGLKGGGERGFHWLSPGLRVSVTWLRSPCAWLAATCTARPDWRRRPRRLSRRWVGRLIWACRRPGS